MENQKSVADMFSTELKELIAEHNAVERLRMFLHTHKDVAALLPDEMSGKRSRSNQERGMRIMEILHSEFHGKKVMILVDDPWYFEKRIGMTGTIDLPLTRMFENRVVKNPPHFMALGNNYDSTNFAEEGIRFRVRLDTDSQEYRHQWSNGTKAEYLQLI